MGQKGKMWRQTKRSNNQQSHSAPLLAMVTFSPNCRRVAARYGGLGWLNFDPVAPLHLPSPPPRDSTGFSAFYFCTSSSLDIATHPLLH
jgi:hypothetical protein